MTSPRTHTHTPEQKKLKKNRIIIVHSFGVCSHAPSLTSFLVRVVQTEEEKHKYLKAKTNQNERD